MMEVIEIKWDYLGAKLASLSDEDQAMFFKGFAKELNNFDTHYSKESQMISVGLKLSDKIKNILETYMPSLWYNRIEE